MNTDQLIQQLQAISAERRKLPLRIECPNGIFVEPKIKMKLGGNGMPLQDNELESIVITWQD